MKKRYFSLYIQCPLALLAVTLLFWYRSINWLYLLQDFAGYYLAVSATVLLLNAIGFERIVKKPLWQNSYFVFIIYLIFMLTLNRVFDITRSIHNIYLWCCVGIMLPFIDVIAFEKSTNIKR